MQSNWKFILDNLKQIEDTPTGPNDRVLLVDSMNTFLRCFAAINHVNPDGVHIGGLTGYLKSIGFVMKIIKPTKVILVFDGQGSNTNKRYLYPEYKANRDIQQVKNWTFNSKEEETEAIINQLGRLVEYLKILPVHLLSIDKIEADDVIGYLSQKFDKEVTIMSADRDFLQLVSDRITVYSPTKKKFYTPKKVYEEYNIYPHNFLLYKTLMGDKGDNIPKIKGFGEAKLYKLLPQLKEEKQLTLKEGLELINPKDEWGNKILNFRAQLEINEKLIDLTNPMIPESELETINYTLNSNNSTFDKSLFISMYKEDKLGDSIPNLDSWLESNFKYLTTF